ncbi:hypothetical protein [Pedobacter nutrimenti]|jgi:hypothetical protein|uniref:PepSY-like beta-lactamase-inhibitor n=1 Tax=Pedobacter nutrimenti TaxID=1241337 RepID=A0A318U8B7_9SPHI|nr:hypothetical protein [Pedobacter nutrimenti]PYF70691.1 hypothetical protein B0O44_108117 [Pedobacter nutrimenti]
MKQIILSAAFLAFVGLTTVKANEVKTSFKYTVQQDSSAKTPVELKDLPAAVQTTLQTDPIKQWTPTAAFLVTNADKTTYYQIDLKKEDKTATIKMDKDGKAVK